MRTPRTYRPRGPRTPPTAPVPESQRRKTYTLTPDEVDQFRRLSLNEPTGAHVWVFWKGVCKARGLDYRTVLVDSSRRNLNEFTALPADRKKHWCWPIPLRCIVRPRVFD